jgi:hypothetical protein
LLPSAPTTCTVHRSVASIAIRRLSVATFVSYAIRHRPDPCLLDRVSREIGVPEDQSGRRVQPRDGQVDEHGEGGGIALPCSLDETSLVHGRLGWGTASLVVLTGYGVSRMPIVLASVG